SDGVKPATHGHATYIVKVTGLSHLPADEPLGMVLPPIATTFKAWWITGSQAEDIELISQRGILNLEKPIPQWSPEMAKLPTTRGDSAFLVIQVVNHHFWLGGIFYPAVSIHNHVTLNRWFDGMSFLSMLVLGFIFMMAFYHFGLFLLRRQDRASLLFSLFCAVMFIQSISYRHWLTIIWLHEPTEFNFLLELFMMSIGAYFGTGLFVTFVSHLFPDEFPKWFSKIVWAICLILVGLNLIMGPAQGSELTPAFLILIGIVGLPVVYFLVRATLAKRLGAGWVLGGFFAMLAGTLHDVLSAQQLWNGNLILTPFGLLGFFFAQSVILSKRNAIAHAQAEHLSENLQSEVDQRTSELESKTLEAQEATQVALAAQQDLEEANRQLLKIDQQKTSFFQSISHELRTPLTLILGPLEEQIRSDLNNSNIQTAVKNARRLLKLVNQLLDFQKIQAGRKTYDLTPVDLGRFLQNCQSYVETSCKVRNIHFKIELPPGAPTVCADIEFDGLEKICFNFLANALKFTPDGGAITLGLSQTENSARIFVQDNGPGIAENDQAKLFKLFAQVGSTAGAQGTGIGLALAKELAEGMSGQVGVTSTLGKGSTFYLDLPKTTRRPIESAEATPINMDLSGEYSLNQISPEITAPQGAGATILVVDDLKDMRSLIASQLTRSGYQVLQATDGENALESAKAHQPDLMITDWMMPVMDGPALVKAWRSDPGLSGTPIIMLTARSDTDSKVESSEVGADSFIGKPFQDIELLATVRNLLALKENEKQLRKAYQELEETTAREIRHSSNLLKQAEKMASLGQLIASIGHEIANPVSLVKLAGDELTDHTDRLESSILSLFQSRPEKISEQTGLTEHVDELRENLGHIRIAGERLENLSGALRTQSRHEEERTTEVDLQQVIEESLLIVRGKLSRYHVTVEAPELPTLTCIRSQIGQVFVNLFSNAGDALASRGDLARANGERFRGAISISLSEQTLGGKPGLLAQVEDNGTGVSPEIAEKIFDAFVTTKEAGMGTGLGLMLSQRIIDEHQGKLELIQNDNAGAVFRIWLPRESEA
ncbi:MAG: response regulator, partial [Deltaproteobacteria bacterium]|nr:response regulator [Deltaproteobacteria bacterium]